MNFAQIWCVTNPTPTRRVTPPIMKFLNTPRASKLWTDACAISGFTTRMTRFRLKTLKRLSKRNWKAQKGVACEYSCFYLLLAARDVVKGPWRWGARRNGCIRRLRKDACTRESDRNMTFVVRRHQVWCVMSDLDLGQELADWGDVVAKKVIQKKGTFSSKGSNWVHSLDGLDKLMGHQNSTFRVPFPFN